MPRLEIIYKKLLFLYPEQYREQYSTQVMQTMEDILTNEPKFSKRVSVLVKEVLVLPGNVLEQHLIVAARRGGLTTNILMGLIVLSLLMPFFLAMTLDEMSEYLHNQHLYNSWFWSKPVLTIWIIALPLLGLFISLSTYLLLALRASVRAGRLTFQIKRLWLVIVTGLISLSILLVTTFHASLLCWPTSVKSVDNAVRCTENVFLNSDKK